MLLIASFFHCAADETHVTTKRGAEVSVLAEFPTGNGPFPTVVLAPGQGYHMRLPVLVETTKQLIARGYAVYRFDWAYFTKDAKHGEPAEDLSTEVEDMRAVLDLARVDPRVDKTKMSVGGKSLGSLVAWQVFTTDKALRSGLFLTPVCSHTDAGKPPVSEATENYAGSHQETRPVAYISGDHDPLCSTPLLYRFAESAGGPARVAVVGGDHSFRVQNSAGAVLDAPSTHSVSLVADLATNFIDNTLRD
ncbi:MAG: alpha/beta hydrolase [Burkholderiales bacterium]|nr:alpha/beta hydrolase [Burkholderiales bacterium]